MAPLGVSFSLLIEDQGLIKVDLSAMLDPFDSIPFMLCPWAMTFFQKLCPAPFPPVTKLSIKSLSPVRLCNPIDCSMPGSSVLYYLLEFAQVHVH